MLSKNTGCPFSPEPSFRITYLILPLTHLKQGSFIPLRSWYIRLYACSSSVWLFVSFQSQSNLISCPGQSHNCSLSQEGSSLPPPSLPPSSSLLSRSLSLRLLVTPVSIPKGHGGGMDDWEGGNFSP